MDPGDWPIVVTKRAAEAAADLFGFGDRWRAQDWLEDRIAADGVVLAEAELPGPVRGRRSPSGHFVVVDGAFALPLAPRRGADETWAATDCVAFPRARSRVDPLLLRGWDLLELVNFLPHAVERFVERTGVPEQDARGALVELVGPTARAQTRPPVWAGTRDADFHLVAGEDDRYCLPCRSGPDEVRPYDAVTFIQRDEAPAQGPPAPTGEAL
ncbi:hypothetical protein [Actinokineospora bangkokensis]|uniref:Uncharacterized protein n=1 Tax=Actinokineospora bangkokensis TaxID=1193682 RepID=A0A1Q9LG44_9PSEU|nr:hypothetical protein [Actinokineospora bangkokensis]OLR90984.1 hypothetical protein BJP25_31030 [Actinokineospora bangkokensis]